MDHYGVEGLNEIIAEELISALLELDRIPKILLKEQKNENIYHALVELGFEEKGYLTHEHIRIINTIAQQGHTGIRLNELLQPLISELLLDHLDGLTVMIGGEKRLVSELGMEGVIENTYSIEVRDFYHAIRFLNTNQLTSCPAKPHIMKILLLGDTSFFK